MKKKSNTPIFLGVPALAFEVVLMFWLLAGGLAAQTPGTPYRQAAGQTSDGKMATPAEGDGKGIVVRIDLPWRVLLERENITFYYVLENRSNTPIPVAFPFGEPFGWPNGGQAFLAGVLAPGSPEPGGVYSDFPWMKVEEATWPPRDEEGNVVLNWGSLPAGQRVVWNRNRLRASDFFRVHSSQYLRAIQGQWLVGKGHWVSSEPVEVEVRDVPESQWVKVFEGEWSSYGRGLDRIISHVVKVPLDGK